MRVAVIGCGEVGTLYAGAFRPVCDELYLCDPKHSLKTQQFASDHHAVLATEMGEWLRGADLALSCVVGGVSLDVAKKAFPYMQPGAIYADMTTCDPAQVREAAKIAEAAGIRYVDVGIMGAVALAGVKTSLLCAGPAAEELVGIFTRIGAPARVLEGRVAGDAMALKILRSVFAKGLEALAIEAFLAAEQQGVTDELYEVLADIDRNPLRSTLESFVRTHLIHACRRLKEIEEAERLLREADLPVAVLPGVRALFERTCRQLEKDPVKELPATAKDAFAWLSRVPRD